MPGYRARRRISLLILLIGLPVYLVVVITLMNWLDSRFGRQPILLEVAVYLVLGFAWILPFRAMFRGIGKPDPDGENKSERPEGRSDQ
jgi:predicted membrane channel-forming protein YqfA (hemolysin III family)